jgi:hypothetical protein
LVCGKGKEGIEEGGWVQVNMEIVELFSCYTISLNSLKFTQYLILSILVPQHSRNCECLQTFQKKLSKIQSVQLSSVQKHSDEDQ